MSSGLERFDTAARRMFDRMGNTTVRGGELLRHPLYTRFLHWMVALFFVVALVSGFAMYSPHLYHWLSPLFGGGPTIRWLHPWLGVGFTLFFLLQFLNWLGPMSWTKADSTFMRHIREYATNKEEFSQEDIGFFNGGQKFYFWTIALSVVIFLITGIPLWLDQAVSRLITEICYVFHDVAALVMLGGFMIHVYQSTASEPGTFRSMIDGTVTRAWAWMHHPAWYRRVTEHDPPRDYEKAG